VIRSQLLAATAGLVFGLQAVAADPAKTNRKFAFGSGKAEPGFLQVSADTVYSPDRGYGFEPGSKITVGSAAQGGYCASDTPFYFTAAVPEGNYTVTVTFAGGSDAVVKAESRRLLLERVTAPADKPVTRSFTVNVRTPKIAGGGTVRLKDREKQENNLTWDERLTLEFNGPMPRIRDIEIVPVDVPTVYILGDSTVCDQSREPYASWGQMLPVFFKPGVAVANHAESGESLKSSANAQRLDKVLSRLKAGDYVFIQFGHNDMKAYDEVAYKAELRRYVSEIRKKEGTAVVITPMHRRRFDGPTIESTHRGFPDAVRDLAKEEHIPLIDLIAMSRPLYEALGPDGSGVLFAPKDGTHHNNYGAYELARCVVEGVRSNKLGLTKFLCDDVKPFDPAKPDPLAEFKVPPSPRRTLVVPEGK
jgi:lysophospholipase L1-like esterase